MTPVAGGIANAQQDWLVLGAGALNRFLAPRIPIDRIMRVLAQVWAAAVSQRIAENGVLFKRFNKSLLSTEV